MRPRRAGAHGRPHGVPRRSVLRVGDGLLAVVGEDAQLAGGYAYARLAATEVLDPATGCTVARASSPPRGAVELLEPVTTQPGIVPRPPK